MEKEDKTFLDKDGLVRTLSERSGYNQGDCKHFLDTLIEVFGDAIQNQVGIKVRGFGELKYKTVPEHEGNKPIPGKKGYTEKILIPETTSARFMLSTDLRGRIKQNDD